MNKKIAIMQPYFFPYIGYWQLISEVDVFVIFNDVNFIKKGWIHRNNILLNGKKHLFSLPLKKASQNKKINEIELLQDEHWKSKYLTMLQHAYKKAPMYNEVWTLIETAFLSPNLNLSTFLKKQIDLVNMYLGINTIVKNSEIYQNQYLKGQERIIDICKKESADIYVNPIGGQELYDKKFFQEKEIVLKFLKSRKWEYVQFKNEFLPWLSMIDVLMFNEKAEIQKTLNSFDLI